MKALIKVGVVLNLLIGLGHLLCMAALDKIFAIYGISDVMDRIAQYGTYLPYVITIIIAVVFLWLLFTECQRSRPSLVCRCRPQLCRL